MGRVPGSYWQVPTCNDRIYFDIEDEGDMDPICIGFGVKLFCVREIS